MSIKNPITNASQLRKPLVCRDPGSQWRQNTASQWWSPDYKGFLSPEQKKMIALRDRLLTFGGYGVCMPAIEEDLEAIMNRGQLFYGKGTRFKKGKPNECHRNSCLLWEANRDKCSIATGYALSEDGIWRQHSWVVQPLQVKYRVWETTVGRVAYFGFIMTQEECERFVEDNF